VGYPKSGMFGFQEEDEEKGKKGLEVGLMSGRRSLR